MTEHRMLIDGKLVEAEKTFDNVNPATEEVIGGTPTGHGTTWNMLS
jgi:aldehyde dehydrogenase (NAD+)